ncbi:glycosyltransferase [Desulfococcaceae bacterium HSG7]|nr:glycosyltransferase [Desulfococcaceae bacterium HSG7]
MIGPNHSIQRIKDGYDKNLFLFCRGIQAIQHQGIHHFYTKFKYHYKRYDRWIKKNEITNAHYKTIKAEICTGFLKLSQDQFKISIIMPVYNVPARWLKKAIASVQRQLYDNWELCIVDDNSAQPHIRKILKTFSSDQSDSRIKVKFLNNNIGISGASNEALAMATGDFIGLLDNDDELSIDALYEVVKLLNEHPTADMIYSDEDKLGLNGKRCEPFFKPDWSPDMLLACMYTGHFSVYRKKIVDRVGGFRTGFDGSQDYDLALRITEKTDQIFHIPKILYHWRKIPGSVALKENSKTYAYSAAQKALTQAMQRRKIPCEVKEGQWLGSYRVQYEIVSHPKISILIPTRDQAGLLTQCINSVLNLNTYPNYEIIIINNNSVKQETAEYLAALTDKPGIRILNDTNEFNFAALNNRAARFADGDVLLFLNNDCELKEKDSLGAMAEHIQRKKIGAVGAKLIYDNHTIQHCGIILRLGAHRAAGHHSYKFPEDNHGYFGRNSIIHNVSAVTAAAMMTETSLFNEVGGFNEKLKQAYNDVDFCLKLRAKGYLIVYTPYAVFYHHESASRGYEDTPEKTARFEKEVLYFKSEWNDVLAKGDPYYNPNLTLEREDFSLQL